MAEFWSNNDRGYRVRLQIDQTSQNIAGNSSQVRVRLSLHNNTYTFDGYNCSAYVDVNGQRLNWSGRPTMLSNNSTIMLIDQTITVGHNADGTKSFGLSASFSGSGGWSPGMLSIGGNSFTLTTIPRSSSVSVGAGVIGSSVTINISRQSPSFKHTVRYQWGSKSGTIASNVDTSTTWTIPNDFANDIPNSTSGAGTIYVDTYSGSTKTGTQSTTLTASVPATMKPTFTGVSLSDFNTAAQSLIPGNTFIQVISNIKVTFNGGAGSYGSTITGYKAEIVGKNQTTNVNGGTLGIMNYNGTITVRASVSDSRGRWSDTKDVSVTVLEYFAPALSFSIARTGSTSSTFTVTRNAKVAPLTVGGAQKNNMTLSFKVARLGTTTYTADTGAAAGSWTSLSSLTNSQANLSGSYAANQSWVVIGTLADKFTQTEFAVNVATESVVFSYDRSGVGVNKIRERGALDVNGDIYASGLYKRGNQEIQNLLLVPNDGRVIYAYDADVNLQQSTGLRWINPGCANSPFPNDYGFIVTFRATYDWLQLAYQTTGGIGVVFTRKANRKSDADPIVWSAWEDVSYKKPPRSDVIQRDIGLPYGMKGKLVRQGNLVTLSLVRNPITLGNGAEYAKMVETLPSGFRPTVEATMIIVHNAGQTFYNNSKMYLETNGDIRMTWNHSNYSIATGTVTYITNDPYP